MTKQKFPSVLVGIVVALAIGAGVGWWFFVKSSGLNAADLVPMKPIAFLEVKAIPQLWQNLTRSEFYKNLAKIDVDGLLQRNGVDASDVEYQKNLRAQIVGFLNDPLAQQILGEQTAFAFFGESNNNKQRLSSFLILSQMNSSMRMAMALGHLTLPEELGKAKITSEKYGQDTILRLQFQGKSQVLYLAQIQNWLMVDIAEGKWVKASLDAWHAKSKTLSSDEDYKKVMRSLSTQWDVRMFLDAQTIWNQVFPTIPAGFKTSAFSVSVGPISTIKSAVLVDSKKARPELRRWLQCEPHENHSLPLVPPNVLFYQWSSCYDFEDYWNSGRDYMASNEMVQSAVKPIKHSLEKKFGFSMRQDFLPLLTGEMGFYVTDIDTTALVPLPRMAAFFKVNDKEKMQRILAKVTDKPIGSVGKEDYKGIGVTYMTIPIGVNFEPGYCFVGDYVTVATNRHLLKKSIDAFVEPSQSFLVTKASSLLDVLAQKPMTSMSYIQWHELSKRLYDFTSVVNRWFSNENITASAQTIQWQNKVIEYKNQLTGMQNNLTLANNKIAQKTKELNQGDISVEQAAQLTEMLNALTTDRNNLKDSVDQMQEELKNTEEDILLLKEKSRWSVQMMFNIDHGLVPLIRALQTLDMQRDIQTVSGNMVISEIKLKAIVDQGEKP